jgi:hypothetical protein
MTDSTMTDSTPTVGTTIATTVLAFLTFLALLAFLAACGSPGAAGSSGSPSAVAYSACMRSHGVPAFPDPDSGGDVPKGDAQHFGVSTARLQAAQRACQPLLPAGGSLDQRTEECMSSGNCPPALVQELLTVERTFAQCMRSHGLAHWPDPSLDSQGRPIFVISISKDLGGVDPHAPQISNTEDECGRLTGSPEPREVNP